MTKQQKLLLVGVALILLRFFLIFLGKAPLIGDNFSLMVPGKIFTAQWLRQGVLPLWNPEIMAGIPWIGDINQSIFHPSTLAFLWLSPASALNLTIILMLMVTLLGSYHLSRSLGIKRNFALIAALIWSLSPQMMGYASNIALLQTAALFPWVMWAVLRLKQHPQQWWVLVVVLSVQVLSGYPQYVLYSLAAATLFYLLLEQRGQTFNMQTWRKRVTPIVLATALTLLLTAFVWLPFVATVGASTRVVQSFSQAAAGQTHWSEVIKLWLPNFWDNAALGYKWGQLWNRSPNIMPYIGWFGWLVIGLSLLQWKSWQKVDKLLLSFSVGALALTLLPGLTTNVMRFVPLLQHTRGLNNLLMIPALFLSLLVGRRLQHLSFKDESWLQVMKLAGLGVGLGLVAWVMARFSFESIWLQLDMILDHKLTASAFHTLERDQIIISAIFVDATVAGLSLWLAIFLARRKLWWLVAVMIACELGWQTRGLVIFGPVATYNSAAESNLVAQIKSHIDTDQYRVLTQNYNLPYTGFDAYFDAISLRQPFSDSYVDAYELVDYDHATRLAAGLTPDWNMTRGLAAINGYTTLVPLNISLDFAPADQDLPINNLPPISLDHPNLRKWAVRYYLDDKWFPYFQESEGYPEIWSQEWWSLAEIPGVWSRFRSETIQPYDLKQLEQTPNSLKIQFDNPRGYSALVVADRYSPGWKAWVNGKSVAVENSQGLRKIAIDPGQNVVEQRYFPPSLYLGILLSVIGLTVVAVHISNRILRLLDSRK